MRTRALSVIGLTFAILVFGRAYEVSSEITSSSTHETENHNENSLESEALNPTNSDGHSTNAGDAPQQCLTSEIHDVLIADTQRIKHRESKIGEREAALQKLETTLTAQLVGIDAANANLKGQIAALKAGASEDLTHLVGMYQTMKPKLAAKIFNSMDAAFAAGFLREMNSSTAGLIMANMDAKRSYTISVIIAQRNAKYR